MVWVWDVSEDADADEADDAAAALLLLLLLLLAGCLSLPEKDSRIWSATLAEAFFFLGELLAPPVLPLPAARSSISVRKGLRCLRTWSFSSASRSAKPELMVVNRNDVIRGRTTWWMWAHHVEDGFKLTLHVACPLNDVLASAALRDEHARHVVPRGHGRVLIAAKGVQCLLADAQFVCLG